MTGDSDLLDLILPTGSSRQDALDAFVGRRLHEAGVWQSPRSDGMISCRVRETGASRVRLSGKLWAIEQTIHAFWLDVVRNDAGPAELSWTLYLAQDEAQQSRRARNAIDTFDDPESMEWLHVVSGLAVIG